MQGILIASLLSLAALFIMTGLRRPSLLLAAYAAVIPFGSMISVPLGIPSPFNTLTTVLGAVTGLILLIHLGTTRRATPPVAPASFVWLIYLGLVGFTYVWTIDGSRTIDDLLVLAPLITLYFLVVITPFDRHDIDLVERGIVLGGALTGIYGLILLATDNMTTSGAGTPRFEVTGGGGGTGGDPNITAAALLLPLAVALGRALRSSESPAARAIFGGGVLLAVTGIALTASRGGLLAVGFILITTVLIRRSSGRSVALVGALVVAVVLLLPNVLTERVDNTGSSGRTDIWRIALRACPEYCLKGSGYGTFPDVHRAYVLSTPDALGTKFTYQAHNIWIEAAVETGLGGLVVLTTGLLLTGAGLRRIPRERRIGPAAGFVAVLVANVFLSNAGFKYFWFAITYVAMASTLERMRVPARIAPEFMVAGVGSTVMSGMGQPAESQVERTASRHPVEVQGSSFHEEEQTGLRSRKGLDRFSELWRNPDGLPEVRGFAYLDDRTDVQGGQDAPAAPEVSGRPPVTPEVMLPTADGDWVDVNSAKADAVLEVRGLGPALVQRIVEDRALAGPFQSVQELVRVRGINKRKLEAILGYELEWPPVPPAR